VVCSAITVHFQMDKNFFQRKIRDLSDEKLKELIQKARPDTEVFQLTKAEFEKRGLPFDVRISKPSVLHKPVNEDLEQLKQWNWAAFFFAPVWTLVHRLELLTILCFIPFVNFVVMFYLGFKGNSLAYKRSPVRSVNEFMMWQYVWKTWVVRYICISVVLLVAIVIIEGVWD
jgi:hypothetical protein